ncbi:MAG: zinc-binding dehydrogenase [Chloroflexi bacterium]|nr:zinc-binding dehydrogenase [Chloroflexota bacterium]
MTTVPQQSLAAVTTAPNVMEMRRLDIPEIGDDEAIVRIEATGICGTDYEWFRGDLDIPFPIILGHEPLGRIASIGPVASERWGVSIGDRVAVRSGYRCGRCAACQAGGTDPCPTAGGFGQTGLDKAPGLWGGYSEYLYLPAGSVVFPMDGDLDPAVAVMFNPLGAGFAWGVDATGLQPGQTLAVLGSGQRGICCAIAAKESGASMVAITGLGRDEHKLALARDMGADIAINVDGEDPVERVLAATGGAGVDCVVDTTPYAVQAVNHAIQMVQPGGTVVLAGLKGRRAFEGLSPDDIIWKKVTLRGVLGVEYSAFRRAVDTIHSRKYPMERLHTHSFPIEQAERALATLSGEAGVPSVHVAIVPDA